MADFQAPEREKPIFILRPKFTVELNMPMAEELLDLFDNCMRSHVMIPREAFAMYKQLENWVGAVEEDESPRKHRN